MPLMLWFNCEELLSPLTIKATNPSIVETIVQYLGFHSCCYDVRLPKNNRIASMNLSKEVLLHLHITYLGFYSRACIIDIASSLVAAFIIQP